MTRILPALFVATVSFAGVAYGQQGQSGHVMITTKVDGVSFQTDYIPGDVLWAMGAAEVSVASGGSVTDFRLTLQFFDASSTEVEYAREFENNIQPGAMPVTFYDEEEVTSESQMAGNFYNCVVTLEYYHEGMGLWQDVDWDQVTFTTD